MKYILLFILFLFVFSLLEMAPILITLAFPSLCYGSTTIGKIHQYLNVHWYFSYFNWICYSLLLLLCTVYAVKNIRPRILSIFVMIGCLFMLYLPLIPLLNFLNFILMICLQNKPFFHQYKDMFPASVSLEHGVDEIRKEYDSYRSAYEIECIYMNNPGFTLENNSTPSRCWRALYLKKGGKINSYLKSQFPYTTSLLEDPQIHTAFFSSLDPEVHIPEHTGYFKGYLRYHLGIHIPPRSQDCPGAFIVCGNEKYYWKKDEGIVFDDMYLHYVQNPTRTTRVVLYIDLIRPTNNVFLSAIIKNGIWMIEHNPFIHRLLKNQHRQKKLTS